MTALTRISICVLNWQNFAATQVCIDALLALPEYQQCGLSVSIIIVDNGSSDGSAKQLERYVTALGLTQVVLLLRPDNGGYSVGNNRGIRYAMEHCAPDFIWILNNDTKPLPGCLSALVAAARLSPSVVIWGSTLLEMDGKSVQCAGGNYYNSWLGLARPALAGLDIQAITSTGLRKGLDYVSGASMFIRADFFRQHGLLDERYFLYYEELDLARRLEKPSQLGWCADSKLIHTQGASVPGEVAVYHSVRSLLIYTKKHFAYKLVTVFAAVFFGKPIILALRGYGRLIHIPYLACWDFLNSLDWSVEPGHGGL